MKLTRQHLVLVAVLCCLFAMFNLADYGYFKTFFSMKMLYQSGRSAKTLFYLFTYLLACAAAAPALFSRSRYVRWTSSAFAAIALAMQQFALKCYGSDIGAEDIQVWWQNRFLAGAAAATFGSAIAWSMFTAVLVMGAVTIAAGRLRLDIRRRWLLLVPPAFGVVYMVVWWTGGTSSLAYPSFFRVPIMATRAFLYRYYDGPREPVHLIAAAGRGQGPKHILFIVDESVRGDCLTINGCPIDTTPFLKSMFGIINLGIACSAANYSEPANLVLRSGIRVDQLPDKSQWSLHAPTIFQYASAAGYQTHYFDGQGPKGVLVNRMNAQEQSTIDDFWQVSSVMKPGDQNCQRDRKMLERIKTVLSSDAPAFIYANKYGSHFDYASTYPAERAVFNPAMTSAQSLMDVDRPTAMNTYYNSVRWGVDDFFKELLQDCDTTNLLIIYTSDHGQSILEGKFFSTQGVVENPPLTQGNVPLFLMGRNAANLFPADVSQLRDRASAFQIFPSLLVIMGYGEEEVTRKYGVPLWRPYSTSRRFLSGDVFGGGRAALNAFDGQTP